MPSNNSKYTQEVREQTARHIIESGQSATRVAEEIGIDKNTVCRWVREYRRESKLPSYAEEKGIKIGLTPEDRDLARKNKELERENRRLKKQIEDEQEKIEILKKSLHIFMQAPG